MTKPFGNLQISKQVFDHLNNIIVVKTELVLAILSDVWTYSYLNCLCMVTCRIANTSREVQYGN